MDSFVKNLQLDPEGIWRSHFQQNVSYPTQGNEAFFGIEDASFWFKHRNSCIIHMVRNFPPFEKGPIFDVGGGNGFVAKALMDAGWDVVLLEPGLVGARNARKRGIQNVICATTQTAGISVGTLPAIGVFDVVEHIDDDLVFLRHLWDLLVPGGMLYLTVPAFQILWSRDDAEAGHFRRYSLKQVERKLAEAGFRVFYATYIFKCLALAIGIFRVFPFRLGFCGGKMDGLAQVRRDHVLRKGLASNLISTLLCCELRTIKKRGALPFGGSCMLAAKKKLK